MSLKYIILNTTPKRDLLKGILHMESFTFEIPEEMSWQARRWNSAVLVY